MRRRTRGRRRKTQRRRKSRRKRRSSRGRRRNFRRMFIVALPHFLFRLLTITFHVT